jgi:hypothetical protein
MSREPRQPIDGSSDWVVLPPAEVLAVVDVAAVPEIPFAALRGSLVPVRDEAGRLVDWTLVASALDDPEAMSTYWGWRRRWRTSWPIGSVANLAALVRTATDIGHRLGPHLAPLLDALASVEADDVCWPLDDADALLVELDALRLALVDTVEAGPGTGIVDETPGPGRVTGLARTWVADEDEQVLSATGSTAVVVRPWDGLVVLHGGPHYRAFPGVVHVDLLDDPAVVTNDLGERLELTSDEARPLAWLVPRALRWHVRPTPLVTVWTSLLVGLPDAVRAACAVGSELRFTTAVPLS